MHIIRKIILAGMVTFVSTVTTPAEEKSWKVESVLPKIELKQIIFGDYVEGKQLYYPYSTYIPVTVREELDGWIRIHDGFKEGWAYKEHFVLVADSVIFFHNKVKEECNRSFGRVG